MASPDLADLSRRPARYWHVDGLPELMLGLLWMIWGGAWLLGQRLPHDWRWTAYWLLVPPVLALGGVAINRLTRRLKERITFPRAGYVAWTEADPHTRTRVAALILVAAGALAFTVLAGRAHSAERTAPLVLTAVLTLSFLAIGVRQRAPHFLALGACAVILAVIIAGVATGYESMNWLFVTLGAACAAVGAARLALFVRHHPRVTAEDL